MEKTKEDLNKWKNTPCSWISRFNTGSNKNPGKLFCIYKQTDSKVYIKRQKT